MAGSYRDSVNTPYRDNSRGISRGNRKGKDPERAVRPQIVEEAPALTSEDKLQMCK